MVGEAYRLEKIGALTTALAIYQDALAQLSDQSLLVQAFEGYFRLQSDPESVFRAYLALSAKTGKARLPPGLSLRAGWLCELSGDVQGAASLYRKEYSDNRNASALDAAVRLEIEMNDVAADAETGSQDSNQRQGLILGYRALQRGDTAQARQSFSEVLDNPWSQDARLQAMYGLFLAALSARDAAEIRTAVDRLGKAFPLSPEYALALGQGATGGAAPVRILSASVPGQFLDTDQRNGQSENSSGSGPAALSDRATEQDAAAVKPAQKLSIQVGAYQMRENADDMVSELKKRGFPAEIRQITVSGKAFFKAFAAVSLEEKQTREMLVRLKEAGFEGYLLPE